ncbi:MAG TPA: peptidoglycan DD-metalloendopeptidase family protein [Caulobacteraceae bacterium]
MPEFDPRQQPIRLAPTVFTVALASWVAGMVMGGPADAVQAKVTEPGRVVAAGKAGKPDKTPEARLVKAAHKPAPPPPPVYEDPETVRVKLRNGETLEAAVIRAGCAPEEAAKAADVVLAALKDEELKPGVRFEAAVSRQRGQDGAARLVGLNIRPQPERLLTVERTYEGRLRLTEKEEKILEAAGVVEAEIRGSLYTTAQRAGVDPSHVKEIVKAFQTKVDFERDLRAGDKIVLVFDQKRTASGQVIENQELLYARLEAKGKTTGLYRVEHDGKAQWLDQVGTNLKSYLLRTPVEGARMSSGFGMRRHPILGYHKMHQGVDFAAGTGTPVLAAGDGTVVEVRRWGGYGNWLRIKHSGGYESGYAHLSRYAKGLNVGDKVKQGEVVAYVGSTGRSTGPHLHHEIWHKGKRVDPKSAKIPSGGGLESKQLIAFKAQKKKVDAVLKGSETQMAETKSDAKVAGLRSKQGAA